MIALYGSFKFLGRIAFKANKEGKILSGWIQNVRLCSAEAKAIQPITVRSMKRSRKTSPFTFGSCILLLIPASSFGLGVWQVFRKFEKDEINEKLLEKTKQPTVDLPVNLDKLKDMEFCSVRVKGKFDHSKEIHLGPRPLIDDDYSSKSLSLLSKSKAGYLVITPFKLSDRNLTILVNRGWVPVKHKSPDTRPDGQTTEEVELVGLVRNHEVRKPFGAKNAPERGIWVFRDLIEMSEVTGAAPVLLDAVSSSSVPGGPIGGQTIVEFKNDHLSYLITWFSLSVVTSYMWYIQHLRRLKRR